jgi:transposase InsO family protein
VRLSTPPEAYTAANQEWALDFVNDAVASGRSIRVLNVIDAYTRESLAMEVDNSFAGLRVTGYSTATGAASQALLCRRKMGAGRQPPPNHRKG